MDVSVPFASPMAAPPAGRLRLARRLAGAWWKDRGLFGRTYVVRTCPICTYRGRFVSAGHPLRWDARCLSCGSRERHRLLQLWMTQNGVNRLTGKRILHVAPEAIWQRMMRSNPLYETADLARRDVDHRMDITAIPMPDECFDVVIANHVFEHVADDRAAMRELFRILRPGGLGLFTTPVNPTRQETYENASPLTAPERWAHFSEVDHVRYYGLDFTDRLAEAGFRVETFRMRPEQEVQYGLLRQELIYIGHRDG